MEKNNLTNFLDYLKYERQASENTLRAYKKDLTLFSEYMVTTEELHIFDSNEDLNKITRRNIWGWASCLKKENERTTFLRRISGLRSFMQYHYKIGNIPCNPVTKLNISEKKGKTISLIPQTALQNFLNELAEIVNQNPDDYEVLRDYCMIEVFYGCGLRRSELEKLTLKNIDLTNSYLKLIGKGKKERIIPFSLFLKEVLCRYIQFCEGHEIDFSSSTFFKTKKGKPMNTTLVYNVVIRTLNQKFDTGKPENTKPLAEKIHPHLLRHSYATHLIDNGADLNSVKELLGHSSLKSTEVYVHNSIQKLKDIHKKSHPKG